MNENIKKFLEKAAADQELLAELSQIRDPEEAYKLAASIQSGFTKDEFVTEMKRLYEETTKDLSEEDMAKVAGGVADWVSAATASAGVTAATASIGISILAAINAGSAAI